MSNKSLHEKLEKLTDETGHHLIATNIHQSDEDAYALVVLLPNAISGSLAAREIVAKALVELGMTLGTSRAASLTEVVSEINTGHEAERRVDRARGSDPTDPNVN